MRSDAPLSAPLPAPLPAPPKPEVTKWPLSRSSVSSMAGSPSLSPSLAGSSEQCWDEMLMRKCIIQHFISGTSQPPGAEPQRAFITVRALIKGSLIRAACAPGPCMREERAGALSAPGGHQGFPLLPLLCPGHPQGTGGPGELSLCRSGDVPVSTTGTTLGCPWDRDGNPQLCRNSFLAPLLALNTFGKAGAELGLSQARAMTYPDPAASLLGPWHCPGLWKLRGAVGVALTH